MQLLMAVLGAEITGLTGPESYTDGQTPITHTELVGGIHESYSAGGPGGATLQSITPSASQTLTASSTVTFTYNFTGTNTFNIGDAQPITTVMGTGESAQIQLPQLCLVTGAAQTDSICNAGAASRCERGLVGKSAFVDRMWPNRDCNDNDKRYNTPWRLQHSDYGEKSERLYEHSDCLAFRESAARLAGCAGERCKQRNAREWG